MELSVPEAYRPHLRVGTCSWKYDSWKGLVYTPGTRYRANDYLPDYARVADFIIADEPFSVANGLLTPTGKLRREAVALRYIVPADPRSATGPRGSHQHRFINEKRTTHETV